ncbi:TerD family protein [Flammeovirga sp. SubArs3]|uniref:TerD family protein n=1 Tax=Flammeovirga sp. SubArs3 TaxID=2995316 RepID=UPI00248C5F72|nr:TerD family protein [Flammeovirga sp. SubArs3]
MSIELSKGQRINLENKSGGSLLNFCVGVNWGAIVEKKLFGLYTNKLNVDLDLSVLMLNKPGELIDYIYSPKYDDLVVNGKEFPKGKLMSEDGALRHSGDDTIGDQYGDDGLDNEVIIIDLARVQPEVTQIYFFLNIVGEEDFSKIPFAKIRMYDGTPYTIKTTYASYDVATEKKYASFNALIMGKLFKQSNDWKFLAIGEPTEDQNVGETIGRILESFQLT